MPDDPDEPAVDETATMTRDQLAARFPRLVDDDFVRAKAMAMGMLEPLADGTFRVRGTAVLAFGASLVARGVPPDVALHELEALEDDIARIAARFTALFRAYILPRLVEEQPDGWLARVADLAQDLRPALHGLVARSFEKAMDNETSKARRAVARMAGVDEASLAGRGRVSS